MSGIFGLIRFDGENASSLILERMSNILRHRGPDRIKFAAFGSVGLGHCLMRVNREDYIDAQPLRDDAAGLVLVADCRIDNREALAGALGLGDDELALLADSALILRAYRRWGADCADRLLGDFAFALWDGARRELILARDAMGERALYYHRGDGFLAFATEIKALWAIPEIPRQLSEKEIGRHLLLLPSAGDGETFFESVTFAPGGHYLRVSAAGALTVTRYWEPHADPAHLDKDEAYYAAAYRRLLTEAVDCRIRRTIAPPALLLSAGFDSAAIAGLAQPRLAAQKRKLLAFASVLPEDYSGPYTCVRPWVESCRRIMPHLDLRYFVQTDENVLTRFDMTSYAAERPPMGGHHLFGALHRLAAQAGARLVMDGFGGDSTLNPRIGNVLAHFLRQGRILLFLREFLAQRRSGDFSTRHLLVNTAKQLIPVALRRVKHRFRAPERGTLIAPAFAAELVRAGVVNVNDSYHGPQPYRSPREKMLFALRLWVARNHRNHANEAAALGLELARPFRDRRIVELALAIPEELYIKDGRHRYLAQKALADVYPPEFQGRKAAQESIEPRRMQGLAAVLPQIEADLERLHADPQMRRYLNFKAIRRSLARFSANRPGAAALMRALFLVKFIDSMKRDN